MKRLRPYLIVASAIFLALFVAAAYMLSYALRPTGMEPRTHEEMFAKLREKRPAVAAWADSLLQTGLLRDTFMVGHGGYRLHAYYMPASRPTPHTAIVVHGYTTNASYHFNVAQMYREQMGFNVLLPDLHFHGQSEGVAIQMGWLDRLDVIRWAEVANDLFGGQTQMVIHGFSMGAATVMMLSGETLPACVRCLVEDSGYTSVWDEYVGELHERFHLPSFPLLNMASWLCKHKYGWSFREASSLKQVAKCTLPMFFIHGNADTFVPTRMVYPLYEAKPYPKSIWVTDGAAHIKSIDLYPEEYLRRVSAFVMAHVTP